MDKSEVGWGWTVRLAIDTAHPNMQQEAPQRSDALKSERKNQILSSVFPRMQHQLALILPARLRSIESGASRNFPIICSSYWGERNPLV